MSPIPWFKVDDKLHDHRKVRRARKAAMGVWVLAGSWCMDTLADGFVPAEVLSRWGTPADARRLVEVGLWEEAEKDGERGWQFRNWHDFQPSKAEIEAERETTKKRVQRWREGKRNGVTNSVTNGVGTASPSRPDPTLRVVTTSSQSSKQRVDDDGLDRIKGEIGSGCTKQHARKTADFILAKAPTDVRNPVNYVLKAIRDEPELYAFHRGNPTKDTCCTEPGHQGEWADACRACALDRKLGSA